MSLDSALARVAELNGAFAPPAPAPPPASGGSSTRFAGALQAALGQRAVEPAARAAEAGHRAAAAPGAPSAHIAPAHHARRHYAHLDGDLDCAPELLRRLDALARRRGEHWHVTSGLRTRGEQQRLWDNRLHSPFRSRGRAPPATSPGAPPT